MCSYHFQAIFVRSFVRSLGSTSWKIVYVRSPLVRTNAFLLIEWRIFAGILTPHIKLETKSMMPKWRKKNQPWPGYIFRDRTPWISTLFSGTVAVTGRNDPPACHFCTTIPQPSDSLAHSLGSPLHSRRLVPPIQRYCCSALLALFAFCAAVILITRGRPFSKFLPKAGTKISDWWNLFATIVVPGPAAAAALGMFYTFCFVLAASAASRRKGRNFFLAVWRFNPPCQCLRVLARLFHPAAHNNNNNNNHPNQYCNKLENIVPITKQVQKDKFTAFCTNSCSFVLRCVRSSRCYWCCRFVSIFLVHINMLRLKAKSYANLLQIVVVSVEKVTWLVFCACVCAYICVHMGVYGCVCVCG